ncbi:fecR family protein [Lyngbya aestuarii BL J]|uniref:FecR family protein n=1 Tax=Lyngbya aestuarii BL J TaxID=1348334 RepID=U7QKQ4_9CYAN|nr:fecR family protein [Lyngbya aestuarii]ERT07867.1 fecR family protein [Lyngbya aestuarii BL J]
MRSSVKSIKSGFGSLGVALTITLAAIPAIAQIDIAILTEILGDNNEVFIENQVAQENDDAALGEEVRTEQARAQLDFNTGASGRMTENSSIVVGQCIEVQQGVVVASGPANGCLSGFAVGVQGTTYLMSADEDGIGTITVLEGQIQLALQDNPDDPNALVISGGQRVAGLTQGLALADITIEQITKQEYEAIITGPLFRGYQNPLPDQDKIDEICKRLYGSCVAVGSQPPQPPQPQPSQPSEPPNGTPVRGLW